MLCEKGEAGAGDGHANVQGEAEGRACRATQGPRRGAQAEAQEEGAAATTEKQQLPIHHS